MQVLIVDDDEIFQLITTHLVKKAGLDASPRSFPHGQAAYLYLEQNRPCPAHTLILLDLNMPIMDGWQFLDQVKAHPQLSKYSIAIVSSSTDARDRERTLAYPQVVQFFSKPIRIQYLQELARQVAMG